MLKHGCMAYQASDQMICHKCNLVWDINDPDPPECVSAKGAPKQNPLTEAFDSIIKDNDPQGKKSDENTAGIFPINSHFGKGDSDLSIDQLRETLLLSEGFFTYNEHPVTVVCEKLSPITEEKLTTVFNVNGTPSCQLRRTSRPGVLHIEIRKYLEYKKAWSQWSNF